LDHGSIAHPRVDDQQLQSRRRDRQSRDATGWALALIELGRMRPAGMREIEQAKLDGRWERAYAPQSKVTVPRDLKAALDRNPRAGRHFDELDSHNRYAILHRVQDAKKPETRAQRIETYVTMLGRGKRIYPTK
jgi:uncharacterized protein YdeI (YjbR/CyaY-like superfamily)